MPCVSLDFIVGKAHHSSSVRLCVVVLPIALRPTCQALREHKLFARTISIFCCRIEQSHCLSEFIIEGNELTIAIVRFAFKKVSLHALRKGKKDCKELLNFCMLLMLVWGLFCMHCVLRCVVSCNVYGKKSWFDMESVWSRNCGKSVSNHECKTMLIDKKIR